MDKKDIKSFSDEIINWLSESDVVSDEGAVYSWVNPKKPGYVYSEIIGYYIKFFSYLYKRTGEKFFLNRAILSADYLSNHLSRCGGVSRDGTDYVFDSAICISGLIALSKAQELKEEHAEALKKLTSFVCESLRKRQVAFTNGESIVDLDKWSLSYGSLIIKNCMALHEVGEYFEEEKYKQLAKHISKELVKETFDKDHFNINGSRKIAYTHPHCYATEGLLFLKSKGKDFEEVINKSADWLANNQNEDGSLYSWYNDAGVVLEKQGDATAQAIRIWCCVDKDKYSENIERATNFLKTLQSDQGGLAYNKNLKGEISKDVNSWVSMFAAQALIWQLDEADKEWIV